MLAANPFARTGRCHFCAAVLQAPEDHAVCDACWASIFPDDADEPHVEAPDGAIVASTGGPGRLHDPAPVGR